MSDETDRPSDDAAKKATDPNAPPGWERNAEVASPEEDEAIAGLEQAITAAGNNWLKNRFDLVEDEEGALHAQAGSKLESFGKEADEFVRGFFRGFFALAPLLALASSRFAASASGEPGAGSSSLVSGSR